MSDTTDPTKRIPKSLETDTRFLGTYSLSDLAVAGLPGVLVVLVTQVVIPPSLTVRGVPVSALTIPLGALAIALGAVFVYLTPRYTTSLDWFGLFVAFQRSETELAHEAAKEYTHVERVYPNHDAIERTDRAVVGAVQVDPPTMALATDAEWSRKAEAFQDFVNTTVEFPIQIYSTTRSFPAAAYVGRYEDRLTDPDVQANPHLEALIRHYVDWYEAELAERQMTIRDHYLLLSVRPEEVRYQRAGIREQLANLPVLGPLVRIWTAPSAAAERAAMLEELADRRRRVERGLHGIEGCDTRPVPAGDLTRLIAEYWAGTSIEYGAPQQALRTTPVVTRS